MHRREQLRGRRPGAQLTPSPPSSSSQLSVMLTGSAAASCSRASSHSEIVHRALGEVAQGQETSSAAERR